MYRAPVEEMVFTLRHIAGTRDDALDPDILNAVLEEASRFASNEMAPLAESGDRQGPKLENGAVTMPDGWKELYAHWREGGWGGVMAPEPLGGQGLPVTVAMAVHEMWNSASMSFGLCPMLTSGAVEALAHHASPELQALYLPKLVAGEWTGTMNLTEPQAGSDVGALTTRAVDEGDGTYRIFGQKIFITYGEHDLTENIIHLVLARIEGAPAGTKGISLFLVPKFLVNEDGSLGSRNDLVCAGIEHKLGIHASPTCTMVYGDKGEGAVGWLVGEANRGLNAMFTMMNNARLAVGIQGVALAEAATQKALAYAGERRQGRAARHEGGGMAPILRHPDIQRTLLTMKALTAAARSISYLCAQALAEAGGEAGRQFWIERGALLTPVAKAFSTDICVEVASLGLGVHGGMGFIEEAGAARLYRDARIAPIYEGTNGIQAIDLVSRKLPLGGGEHVHGFVGELREIAEAVRASNRPGFGTTAEKLDAALEVLSDATRYLQSAETEAALAGATPYLRLFGLAAGAALLAKGALADEGEGRAALCRFFAENLLGQAGALKDEVTGGAESLARAADLLLAS
ncbi:MAG: acyl-CoA dehydrogenase [Methylobacterium mesophilicum]|nr:acyl-CoA dehydrogenase [Methylobacterium mesophilicum]